MPLRRCFCLPLLSLLFSIALPVTGNAADSPYFTDVTAEAGLADTPGFRLSVADVNGDGYPDILLHEQTNEGTGDVLDKQFLYINAPGGLPGERTYTDYTEESGIRANRAGTEDGRHSNAAIFADVDNDGDLDMFNSVYLHTNYGLATNTNDLLLNDGAAHFTLAPNSPFHTEPIYNTAAAVFLDFDNDGNVDLFVGNWYKYNSLTVDQLYQGHGDGSFTNVTSASRIGGRTTCPYGVAAWDWNNDGFTDIFVPSYSHTVSASVPVHWWNQGTGTFREAQGESNFDAYRGAGSGKASFGSMPRDFDNDGDIDFFEILTHGWGDGSSGIHSTAVTNVDDVFSWDFYRVHGRAAEDPDTSHHGDHYLTWLDLDNDSLTDFALTESGYSNNRFYVFVQATDNTFSPVTEQSGMNGINLDDLPSHNVLALDYDLDGDEDLLVGFGNNTDGIQLWRNDVGTQNNWLVVTLDGGGGAGQANRSAIGARIEVTAGGVTQTREVYAGPGHQGPQVPLSQTFGLGQAALVDSVTVRWPNETLATTAYTNLPVRRFLTIREICMLAANPPDLLLDRDGADLLFSWSTPDDVVWGWNLYRDPQPDPGGWASPYKQAIIDQNPAADGVQFRDFDGVAGGPLQFYLATAVNDCGESPLR